MRRRLASRSFPFLPLLLLMGPSCSLVYDLSPDQCGTSADCAHFGSNLVCEQGICKSDPNAPQGGTGGKGDGGTGGGGEMGGTGGTSGTVGGDAGMGPDVGGSGATGGA